MKWKVLVIGLLANFMLDGYFALAQTTAQKPAFTAQQLLFYLAQEKVAVAGQGFKDIGLGDTFSRLFNRWGTPDKQQHKAQLNNKIALTYRADFNTLVVFTGDDRIRKIQVQGNPASLFRTNKGAHFGMTPLQVERLYKGEKPKIKEQVLYYKAPGIDFYFTDNRLTKIEIK